jgi:hypothetical protein
MQTQTQNTKQDISTIISQLEHDSLAVAKSLSAVVTSIADTSERVTAASQMYQVRSASWCNGATFAL